MIRNVVKLHLLKSTKPLQNLEMLGGTSILLYLTK
jgi:hypothetical protein